MKTNSEENDRENNPGGRYEFKGYALHWLTFRKPVIFEVLNSPEYLPALYWAMDDLYYTAVKVDHIW